MGSDPSRDVGSEVGAEIVGPITFFPLSLSAIIPNIERRFFHQIITHQRSAEGSRLFFLWIPSEIRDALLEAIQRVERAVFWWGRSPAIPEEGALSCALRRGGTVAGELGCGEMLLMKK